MFESRVFWLPCSSGSPPRLFLVFLFNLFAYLPSLHLTPGLFQGFFCFLFLFAVWALCVPGRFPPNPGSVRFFFERFFFLGLGFFSLHLGRLSVPCACFVLIFNFFFFPYPLSLLHAVQEILSLSVVSFSFFWGTCMVLTLDLNDFGNLGTPSFFLYSCLSPLAPSPLHSSPPPDSGPSNVEKDRFSSPVFITLPPS